MDIAIASLLNDAAAHPGLTGAIAGLTFLAVGVWWVLWSLIDRVAELEGRHDGLAHHVADLDGEHYYEQKDQWDAIVDTRRKVAQLGRRVRRMRDAKGRFMRAHKAA